jgi:hypothetical protein
VGRSGHRRCVHQQRRERHSARAAESIRGQTARRRVGGRTGAAPQPAGRPARRGGPESGRHSRHESGALVRELRRQEQPRVAAHRTGGWPHPALDR